jgi:hypothetical protein
LDIWRFLVRIAAVLVALGLLVMLAGLIYGFAAGGGWEEVGELMGYPWFVVSLIDVYVGFGLFCGWVAYREYPMSAVVWIMVILTLGNVIACAYVLIAMYRCGSSMQRFWLGRRASS